MATPTQNNFIQQALDSLNQKFDSFIAALPNTYVTIRSHEIQIKSNEEKIQDVIKRLDAMEEWRVETGKWSIDQHDNMRKEWTGEVKDVNSKLDSVETSVIKMTEQQGHQTKILTWTLTVFTTLTLTVIGGIVVAIATHFIHL